MCFGISRRPLICVRREALDAAAQLLKKVSPATRTSGFPLHSLCRGLTSSSICTVRAGSILVCFSMIFLQIWRSSRHSRCGRKTESSSGITCIDKGLILPGPASGPPEYASSCLTHYKRANELFSSPKASAQHFDKDKSLLYLGIVQVGPMDPYIGTSMSSSNILFLSSKSPIDLRLLYSKSGYDSPAGIEWARDLSAGLSTLLNGGQFAASKDGRLTASIQGTSYFVVAAWGSALFRMLLPYVTTQLTTSKRVPSASVVFRCEYNPEQQFSATLPEEDCDFDMELPSGMEADLKQLPGNHIKDIELIKTVIRITAARSQELRQGTDAIYFDDEYDHVCWSQAAGDFYVRFNDGVMTITSAVGTFAPIHTEWNNIDKEDRPFFLSNTIMQHFVLLLYSLDKTVN